MSFILVDCNNFYASCERLFNPQYDKRPLIVLSNNDGCVVARSQEAKQLGIKMGEPLFKIKELCRVHNVVVCSSNYELYGDLSRRIMDILGEMAPQIQVYSIDEAFLVYPRDQVSSMIYSQCLDMRRIVKMWVGITTSIGIAPTKTLAKLANSFAKKEKNGVFDLTDISIRNDLLKKVPVSDIWGVGGGYQSKLQSLGIYTAFELRESDPLFIRKKLGVIGERMVWELRGISCLPLEESASRKSITCSRSFGKPVLTKTELAEALSTYVNTACIKLRKQRSCVRAMSIHVEVMLNKQTGERRYLQEIVSFPSPTNDTPHIIKNAKKCLKSLFYEGLEYKKCGVTFLDLIDEVNIVHDLFIESMDPKRKLLMHAVDSLNMKFGKNTIFYGAMGIDSAWTMKKELASPHFTTDWSELAIAHA